MTNATFHDRMLLSHLFKVMLICLDSWTIRNRMTGSQTNHNCLDGQVLSGQPNPPT